MKQIDVFVSKKLFCIVECVEMFIYFPLFNALATGMHTNAPEIMIDTISGPSMRGVVVMTRKQSDAQSKIKTAHCGLVRDFRMKYWIKKASEQRFTAVGGYGIIIKCIVISLLQWHRYMRWR